MYSALTFWGLAGLLSLAKAGPATAAPVNLRDGLGAGADRRPPASARERCGNRLPPLCGQEVPMQLPTPTLALAAPAHADPAPVTASERRAEHR